jgi:hypothetical protein
MSGSMTPKGRNSNLCDGRNTLGPLQAPAVSSGINDDDQADSEAVTCSVLCSLMSSTRPPPQNVLSSIYQENDNVCEKEYPSLDNECDLVSLSRSYDCKKKSNNESCTDHLQLPIF